MDSITRRKFRLRPFLPIAVLAALALGSLAVGQEVCPKCGKVHAQVTDSAGEVVRLVNVERSRRGLLPLKHVSGYGAQRHANWMASRRSMQHARSGYAENIAMGQRTPSHVVRTWMNSSGHRAAILSRRYTTIDVGRSGNYWCQRFR